MPVRHAFTCLLCASREPPQLVQQEVVGDESGTLRAVRCPACSHVQLSPPSYDLDFYQEDGQVGFVTGHYGTPIETLFEHSAIEARRRLARFADHGETLVRADRSPARLLDIGGGYGFFGSVAIGRRPDVEVRVLEPSARRVEAGRRYFAERADPEFPVPAFEVGVMDDAFIAREQGRHDVVTLWHVLEHVEDPLDFMRRAGRLLRPDGGSLWIEVPNLDDELMRLSPAYRRRSFMREHISYFSAAALERMAHRLFPDAAVAISGYQRYGIFNYFHWIHFDAPQGARPDMFEQDRWWLETSWRSAREAARTSDALLLVVRLPRGEG